MKVELNTGEAAFPLARPMRIEFPGACCRASALGNERKPILVQTVNAALIGCPKI